MRKVAAQRAQARAALANTRRAPDGRIILAPEPLRPLAPLGYGQSKALQDGAAALPVHVAGQPRADTSEQRQIIGGQVDLDIIDVILRAAWIGDMRRLTDLSREAILVDPHLAALLGKRFGAALAWERQLVPAHALARGEGAGLDEDLAKEIADECARQLDNLRNWSAVNAQIDWANWDGRSAHEVVWRGVARPLKTTTVRYELGELSWIHPRRLSYGAYRELRLVNPPDFSSFWSPGGFALNDPRLPHKFLTHTPQHTGDYPEREGLCQRAMFYSYFKRFGAKERMVLLELYGKPWRWFEIDPKLIEDAGGISDEAIEAALDFVENIPGNGWGGLPLGTILKTLQVDGRAGLAHEALVKDCDAQNSKLILGQVATMEGAKAGLNSSMGWMLQDEQLNILRGDAASAAQALEDGPVRSIVALNWGDEVARLYTPGLNVRLPTEDYDANSKRLDAALKMGLEVKADDAYELMGFDRPDPQKDTILRVEQPPMPDGASAAPAPRGVLIYPPAAMPVDGVQRTPAPAIDGDLLRAQQAAGALPPGAPPPPQLPAPAPASGVPQPPQHAVPPSPEGKPPGQPDQTSGGHMQPPDQQPGAPKQPHSPPGGRLAPRASALRLGAVTPPPKHPDHSLAEPGPSVAAKTVYDQLAPDFGHDAIQWVLSVPWFGPVKVPLSRIDFSNKDSWNASHDQGHVDDFKDQVKDEDVKPAILVERPGKQHFMVADGHHRSLAAYQQDEPVLAYVARVGAVEGPWDEMHAAQGDGTKKSMQKSTQKAAAGGPAPVRGDAVLLFVEKVGSKWVVWNHDRTKKLGEYDTKKEAEKRLRQIEYFKHKGAATDPADVLLSARAVYDSTTDEYVVQSGEGYVEVGRYPTAAEAAERVAEVEQAQAVVGIVRGDDWGRQGSRLDHAFDGDYAAVAAVRAAMDATARGAHVHAELRYGQQVCCARRPDTVYGSLDTIVDRGVVEGARVLARMGHAMIDAVPDDAGAGAIYRALAQHVAEGADLHPFARAAYRRNMHGLMLGTLDSAFEREHDTLVAPDTFRRELDEQLRVLLADPTDGDEEDAAAAEIAAAPRFASMPFARAQRFFAEKKVLPKAEFELLDAGAKRRAFTIARLAGQRQLELAHSELGRMIGQGQDLRQFKQFAKQRLQSAGWTPANKSHVETIFRTNVTQAHAVGRLSDMKQPAVMRARPYWQIRGVDDSRARNTHRAAHGKVLRASDPFFERAFPGQFGYNCRCRATSLSDRQVQERGLVVSSGADLRGLPDPGFRGSGMGAMLKEYT